MISITSYYGSSAAKENKAKKVTIGNFTLYFSFETLIAVKENENLRAIKNYWGAETKEHLNAIDGGTPKLIYFNNNFYERKCILDRIIRFLGETI